MSAATGHLLSITGNLVLIRFEGSIRQNEIAYIQFQNRELLCEVIRISGDKAYAQVYESTRGLYFGCPVAFTGQLLEIRLGPGLIGGVFDGLENDLYAREGIFLQRGERKPALEEEIKYDWKVTLETGTWVEAGDRLGYVMEKGFKHYLMCPPSLTGQWQLKSILPSGEISSKNKAVATLQSRQGEEIQIPFIQNWPIRRPLTAFIEKERPGQVLFTGVRLMDILYPLAEGGTGFIPGPFGCGKTVLQQAIAKNAAADLIIFAACGERANEITELLHTYQELIDPHTGKKLMERTILICNTSNMPVAAREASVYTAMTIAEYYRNQGLKVLLLADSTSRWAQALRELSNRMEELPGPEAYPMDLPTTIASFYARAGKVKLKNEQTGSITFIGTVSPAGGNLKEPVTESTRKVARCYYALAQQRADTKRYPAIDPLESYSHYLDYPELNSFLSDLHDQDWISRVKKIQRALQKGREASEQINILGDDGVPLQTHLDFWKSELVDFTLLQQDAFDRVDSLTPPERQAFMAKLIEQYLDSDYRFGKVDDMIDYFKKLIYRIRELNYLEFNSSSFDDQMKQLPSTERHATA
jgi:V/A-type H+-transporting ATPase subunit A